MLWTEFVENTGCKQTEYNYKVYKNLEELYMMNDLLSKSAIYETGKKLVDNSKTAEEEEIETNLKKEKESLQTDIEDYKKQIDYYKYLIEYRKEETEMTGIYTDEEIKIMKKDIKDFTDTIKRYRNLIKRERNRIKNIEFIMNL